MRRLSFTTYPDGWHGLGLLLLRIAVGITAGVQGGVYLTAPGRLTAWMWIIGSLMLVSGAFLLIGFLLSRIPLSLIWRFANTISGGF